MDNLSFVKSVRDRRRLTNAEIAGLTEYSLGSVQAWFSRSSSNRHRAVPDRAVTILKLRLGMTDKEAAAPPQ